MNSTFFELTPIEFRKFKRFLESPYFNTNKKLSKLAGVLKILNGKTIYEPHNKEMVWTKVNGGEKFNDSRYRKMMSELNILYENFLAQTEFEKDTCENRIYLIRQLTKKGDHDTVGKICKEEIKKITSQFLKNEDAYLFLGRLYDELYHTEIYTDPFKSTSGLFEKGKNLNYAFIFEKLHNYITHFNHKHNYKFGNPDSEPMIQDVLNYVKDNLIEIEKLHPNLTMAYFLVMFLRENYNKKYLKYYEDYLRRIEKKLDKERQYYFRLYLGSMYAVLLERGDEDAWGKIFLNHKVLADSDNLTPEKYLAPQLFTSIVFEALHAREYEWAESFIKKYSIKLMPKERNDSVNIARSRLYLYLGKYDRALECINSVKSNSPLFYLNTKITFCFIHLVRNEYDSVRTLTDSMRKYVDRNKNAPASIIANITTFLEYFKKLEKAKNNKTELKKLLKGIKHSKCRIPSKNLFVDTIGKIMVDQ